MELLKKFSLKAEECIFIDDSPKNAEAAKNVGMKSFCHEKGDVELLVQALRSEKVNI